MSTKLTKIRGNTWSVSSGNTTIGTIRNDRSGFGWWAESPHSERGYRHERRKDAIARLVRIADLAGVLNGEASKGQESNESG